jgi:hypothetical protein
VTPTRRLVATLALGTVLGACAPTALTQAPSIGAPAEVGQAAPAPAAPEGLAYFVGDWIAAATDPKTGVTDMIDYRVEPTLGGAWLAGHGSAPAIKFEARDYWGRDPRTGEIIRTVFNAGGAHASFRSPGWTGDTLVLIGEAQSTNGPVRLRQTITRVGPDEFRAVWEAFAAGAWSTYSNERLTRRR